MKCKEAISTKGANNWSETLPIYVFPNLVDIKENWKQNGFYLWRREYGK